MKSKFTDSFVPIVTLLFALFIFTNVVEAQEKSKKQLKEEQKLEKQKQIALLVESKEFVFVPERVIPQSGNAMILTSEYSVVFHADSINSFLPFFGRGFSGIGYGGDQGMIFEGKPTLFQVEKTKKGYQIKAEVRGKTDFYTMILSVYSDGNAYLTINSNNRSSISYDGDIQVFKKP